MKGAALTAQRMGGGVSSLPVEVTLAEAKELAGAKWQPAWEEKFAEAKISRDEGGAVLEGVRGQGRDLRGALRKAPRHQPLRRVAEALDFSAIVNEKRGQQHLPGTREWVFEAVSRTRRTDAGRSEALA